MSDKVSVEKNSVFVVGSILSGLAVFASMVLWLASKPSEHRVETLIRNSASALEKSFVSQAVSAASANSSEHQALGKEISKLKQRHVEDIKVIRNRHSESLRILNGNLADIKKDIRVLLRIVTQKRGRER